MRARALASALLVLALMGRLSFGVVAFVTMACLLGLASEAHAWTCRTPPIAPGPQGYLRCTVLATSKNQIGIVALIVSTTHENVTEFGYGSRQRTAEGFAAEETAGSFDRASDGYQCKVTVTGARRKGVAVSLTSFDGDGTAIATVTAR
jgi:hypothetical protein